MKRERTMEPRKIFNVTPGLAERIDTFGFSRGIRTEAEAIRTLIERGLEAEPPPGLTLHKVHVDHLHHLVEKGGQHIQNVSTKASRELRDGGLITIKAAVGATVFIITDAGREALKARYDRS